MEMEVINYDNSSVRRQDRLLERERAMEILRGGEYGFLALGGEGGYGVPVNYVYDGKAIYIHSATVGHKVDAITKNSAVSFTVVERHDVRPEQFATSYTSVIVFGIAEFVTDTVGKTTALRALTSKYCPNEGEDKVSDEIAAFFDRTSIIKVVPRHISGKRGAVA